MDNDLGTLDPNTGAAPTQRVKDVAALNEVIKGLTRLDATSALARLNVQEMADGAPPFDDKALRASGQENRCNLNFGDGKARLKAAASGYYDLTDSVPMLAMIQTDYGTVDQRVYNDTVISEEFHRMLKEWPLFSTRYQHLVNKFVRHGLSFFYFADDTDWRWHVAGMDEFKIPRTTTTCEDDCDVAIVFRDVPTGKFYSDITRVAAGDKRWNLKEAKGAIMRAQDGSRDVFNEASWEKFQVLAKNNDVFASTTAQDVVHLVHAWVREFDGKVTQYVTLRDGTNQDFLFKCPHRFASVDQCFTFFLYEIGTNETLHSVRGLGHEIFSMVQVLNNLRCQTVDNAKLSGSLLLQPATETDKEDLAIMFYAGAAYIPPGVKVQNANLNNPSQNILPVIQDMTMLMRSNTSDVNTASPVASQTDKTKFEVQSELTKESVVPTAQMDLFYQPWKRHLTEVWRRVSSKTLLSQQPGGRMAWDMRRRCIARGVPLEAIYSAKRVDPVRALGLGSPTNRLMALDEFMQYYGSLDPVGQNNLLRDRFAQRVGYAQVDRYVPRLETGGRGPLDIEIAELQNAALSAGITVTVLPNDQHILHLNQHFPSITADLTGLETGQESPQLLQAVQNKIAHIQLHMKLLKPDKLQGGIVADLGKQFNNAAERVQAAITHAEAVAKKAEAQAQAQAQPPPGQGGEPAGDPKIAQREQEHQQKMQHQEQDAQLKLQLTQQQAEQKSSIKDAEAAARIRSEATRARITGGA